MAVCRGPMVVVEPRGSRALVLSPGSGEATEIGQGLQRVLSEIDEIAEATLRSISLETMLNPRR